MSSHVSVTDEGFVRVIRMKRPEKKNALTQDMYGAMADALRAADATPSVRASVILGSEGVFTAGNDLADFASGPRGPGEQPVTRFLHAIAAHTKPLIAGVEGNAVGVGLTMLLHCDFVVAAEGAKLHTPFVSLGLVPEAASSMLLPRIAGHQRAAEILMFCEPLTAEAARAAGFINRVTPKGGAEAAALTAAHRVAQLPPEAVRLTKGFLKRPAEPVLERMAAEGEVFGARISSAEAREAFAAFLEKRAPDFSKVAS